MTNARTLGNIGRNTDLEDGADVVDDITPQLGGNLDLNSSDITGTGDISITGSGTFTNIAGTSMQLTDTISSVRITSTDAGTAGPYISLMHDTASPADGDEAGEIFFRSNDSASNITTYARIKGVSDDVTVGTEDGSLFFYATSNGTEYPNLSLTSGGVGLSSFGITKLVTSTAGVNVTGTVAATAYTGDGSGLTGISTDLVTDTTPQLGGTLDANGNNVDMGTNVITDTKVGQWDTAYGWGDHAGVYQPLDAVLTNTTASYTTAEETKLAGIEALADVTDATNVAAALDVATLDTATVAATDLVLTKDVATGNLQTVTAQAVADLAAGGGGGANLAYTASPTNGTVTSDTGTDASLTLADATNAGLMSPAYFTRLASVEAGADVTDVTNVTAAGALMDSEVDADIKTLVLPANTTISTFGASLVDDANAAAARTTLGVGTGDSPQFTAVNVGNATDTTLARVSPGLASIEGDTIALLTATQTMSSKTLADVLLTGAIGEEVFTIPTSTTPVLDPANGTVQKWTLTGASAPTEVLADGESITLMIDDGAAYAITWPTMTWVNNAGVAPTLATTGFTTVTLWHFGTLYGALVGDGT